MKYASVMLAAVTGVLFASPALGQLQKCVAPDGAVIFVNTECPDGYTVEASAPESPPSSPDVQTPPAALPTPSGEPQAAPEGLPAPPEEVGGGGLTACSEGEFEYKEGGIFFTSSRRRACLGITAVCTFSVSRSQRVVTDGRGKVAERRGDAYTTQSSQEELIFTYTDKIGKFGTERIGDVTIRGKVTSWNCSPRN